MKDLIHAANLMSDKGYEVGDLNDIPKREYNMTQRELEYLIWAVRNKETLEPHEKESIIQELNGIIQRDKKEVLDSTYPDGDGYWK
jgi:hypothetical protein